MTRSKNASARSKPASSSDVDHLVQALEEMLFELSQEVLTVTLVPSQRRHARPWDKIRRVEQRNPRWYRELCGRHESSRGRNRRLPDTRIRRQDILRILEGLTNGRQRSRYCPELLAEAQRRVDAMEPAPF